ncbi:MAG: GxxExxY protein [Gammaproteobacteria bacterium]|nr:GxxExxY protein [Gammaproteobacteria bacterium]MCW8988505.1 GxxExxY protein [Gammaproteobacteria bacterium]MCW9031267.1 GxxExxY protein [Gammaproteobacteria bacterium]
MDENIIANKVIGAAIEVHRTLGPGLLESAYQDCLKYELNRIGLEFESESPVTLNYKGLIVGEAYRLDLLIEGKVIIELKTVSKLLDIHKIQLLTYLRLTNKRLGLLINFNEILLKHGINRIVNNL